MKKEWKKWYRRGHRTSLSILSIVVNRIMWERASSQIVYLYVLYVYCCAYFSIGCLSSLLLNMCCCMWFNRCDCIEDNRTGQFWFKRTTCYHHCKMVRLLFSCLLYECLLTRAVWCRYCSLYFFFFFQTGFLFLILFVF